MLRSGSEVTDEKPRSPSISESSASVIKQTEIESSDTIKGFSHDDPLNCKKSLETSLKSGEHEGQKGTAELPNGGVTPEDDFPDGGLRAWLVVFGVCRSPAFALWWFGYLT
jgi:hypothetical protein